MPRLPPAGCLALLALTACSDSSAAPSPPSIEVTASSPAITLERGTTGTLGVTVVSTVGFAGTVTVTALDVPADVTIGSGVLQGGGNVDLTVTVSPNAQLASSAVTVRAEAADVSPSTTTVSLTVAAPPVPFGGTIFIDPDIITPADPTAYSGLAYAGTGSRTMYDRRVANWIEVEAYLFDATYDDGLAAEVQVNPEFGSVEGARTQAERYAEVIGRLPIALRADVETVWIHEGTEPFGGGNDNLLIHVGQAALYEADGILEETFVHEASHTSLDAAHASAPGWLAAQAADGTFISTYAQDHPTREDVAETFLTWLALRHRPDRISATLADTIARTVPHRIEYLDAQGLDLYPITQR